MGLTFLPCQPPGVGDTVGSFLEKNSVTKHGTTPRDSAPA